MYPVLYFDAVIVVVNSDAEWSERSGLHKA